MSEQPPQRRAKPLRQAIDEHAPYLPPKYEEADYGAIKALARGDAPAHLQQRALNLIIYTICSTYDQSYRPGDDGRRDTDFAEGKRFVGNQLLKLLKAPSPSGSGEQP